MSLPFDFVCVVPRGSMRLKEIADEVSHLMMVLSPVEISIVLVTVAVVPV